MVQWTDSCLDIRVDSGPSRLRGTGYQSRTCVTRTYHRVHFFRPFFNASAIFMNWNKGARRQKQSLRVPQLPRGQGRWHHYPDNQCIIARGKNHTVLQNATY